MSSVIKTKSQKLKVRGRGNNKRQAFAEALTSISKKIVSNKKRLVFKIEPKSFKVDSLTEIKETEHFLFIFFPRIRINYEVVLIVDIEIQYISLDEIPLTKIDDLGTSSDISESKRKEINDAYTNNFN